KERKKGILRPEFLPRWIEEEARSRGDFSQAESSVALLLSLHVGFLILEKGRRVFFNQRLRPLHLAVTQPSQDSLR
ncbi:hypothetical protein L345_18364, partial [Ophiophagus hannah]